MIVWVNVVLNRTVVVTNVSTTGAVYIFRVSRQLMVIKLWQKRMRSDY